MTEAHIDARNAQGLVNRPEGAVNQQFGDRTTTNTEGGDAAGRDIDKSTTVQNFNFFGNLTNSDAISQAAQAKLIDSLDPSGDLDQKQVQIALQAALPQDAQLYTPAATEPASIIAQLQEFNKLREFLCTLLRDNSTPESVRPKLIEVLRTLGISEEEIKASSAPLLQSTDKSLNPFLMVVIQPIPANADQVLVKAWLLPEGAETPLEQFEPLDLDSEQKGVACSISEAPGIVNQFLAQSRERLLSKTYNPHITIELFLPLEYLSVDIDQWQFKRRRKLRSLRQQHPILVRSYERLEHEYWVDCGNDWKNNWARLKSCLNEIPCDERFEYLDLDNCNWETVPDKFFSQDNKVGFVVPCLPDDDEQEALFDAVLDASAPMALWFRENPPGLDHMAELQQLLQGGSLATIAERLRKAREDAFVEGRSRDEHFSYHLSILWEDPNRLPPDVMFNLQSPGQSGAS